MMPEVDGCQPVPGFAHCHAANGFPFGSHRPGRCADSIGQAYQHGATDFITNRSMPILCHHVRYMLRTNNVLHALIRSESRLELAQRIARIGNWD